MKIEQGFKPPETGKPWEIDDTSHEKDDTEHRKLRQWWHFNTLAAA